MLRSVISLLIFLSLLTTLRAAEATPFNTILGTQAIGGRYQFTQDTPLLESAKLIAELGSGIMKFSISPQASFGKTKANVRGNNPSLKTLTESRRKTHASCGAGHAVHALFRLGLSLHHTRHRRHFKPSERDLEYREIYDFACHLLRTYNSTGKKLLPRPLGGRLASAAAL